MSKRLLFILCLTYFSTTWVWSQVHAYQGLKMLDDPSRVTPPLDKPRPIDSKKTIFMWEMTWMEIRDAMQAGKTTAIVMTGGLEMSGPYAVTNKHNIICQLVGKRLAEQMGNALVATIVPYVPQGSLDPPGGLVKYPGTISVSESTFQSLLTDIITSLRIQGFEKVLLVGDSGGNQTGMAQVADALSDRWQVPEVIYVPEFYGYAQWVSWLIEQGIVEESEGIHDLYRDSALMMLADTSSVRASERLAADLFSINGVSLSPISETLRIAEALVHFQVQVTLQALERGENKK